MGIPANILIAGCSLPGGGTESESGPPKRTDLDKDYREQKFVYIISHPSYPGEYKVGIAKNAQLRLVACQTDDPERSYKIEYKMETPHFRELEKHIHDLFPNKLEWVQGDLEEIKESMRNYLKTARKLDRIKKWLNPQTRNSNIKLNCWNVT